MEKATSLGRRFTLLAQDIEILDIKASHDVNEGTLFRR